VKTGDTRAVARIVGAIRTVEGAGFVVYRPFPSPALADFDLFLLLHQMGPVNLRPGEAKGAPDHPHRTGNTAVCGGRYAVIPNDT
jgi:redox-sensitive bicupin YhaK (pirin superfamily)